VRKADLGQKAQSAYSPKTNKEKNAMVSHLLQLIENAGYEAINNMPIRVNTDGTLEYTAGGNTLLRFIRNVYGKDNIDELSEEQKGDRRQA
jgi:hypothetical protein